VGRVNVIGSNALLSVNGAIELGHTSGGAGTSNTFGILLVNGGTLQANAIVAGQGSGPNVLELNNASLVLPTSAGTPTSPIASVALTNSSLQLSVTGNTSNIVAGTLTTGGGGNFINIVALPAVSFFPAQFTLLKYSGAIGGAGYDFVLTGLSGGAYCGGYLSNNLANASVDLVLTNCIVPDSFLTWDGTVDGDWDVETANWKNNIQTDLTYADGASVLFNDNASGTTTITLSDVLMPSSVTVSNNAEPYTFVGPGSLSDGASLVKQGTNVLILDNQTPNDFTGGINISAGTLQVGNNDSNGTLPPGNVNNNGTLAFARSDNLVVANTISGSGNLLQNGTNILTLSSANTFTGGVIVAQGTLQIANASALGATNNGVLVAPGATLDFNHFNIGLEPVSVSGAGVGGNGALVDNSGNSGFLSPQTLAYVTLTGDTAFGGTGRWDLRSATTTVTNAALSTGGYGYNLTKVGTNQVSLVAVLMDPALGNIDVQGGILSVEKVTTSLGNPTNTLSISNSATLQFYQVSNVLNKVLVMKDGATVYNSSGLNTFGGPVTLLGSNTFNVAGTWLKFTNSLSGAGSLVKMGNGPLYLTAPNSYSGDTSVNAGALVLSGSAALGNGAHITLAPGATLDVSGRSDGTLTLSSGQALQGGGTVLGSVSALPTTTVSPGYAGLATLVITNLVSLQGTTVMDINGATNDLITGAASITYGGTLNLVFAPGSLALSNSFKLFNAVNYSGGFSTIVPPTPGTGLAWDASQLTASGVVGVTTAPRPIITSSFVSAGGFILGGTNGIPNAPFCVLASTNLAQPLSTWIRTATNFFKPDGTFVITNSLEPAQSQQFYLLQLQ
jgi:autotransporter-associated beta strand protein